VAPRTTPIDSLSLFARARDVPRRHITKFKKALALYGSGIREMHVETDCSIFCAAIIQGLTDSVTGVHPLESLEFDFTDMDYPPGAIFCPDTFWTGIGNPGGIFRNLRKICILASVNHATHDRMLRAFRTNRSITDVTIQKCGDGDDNQQSVGLLAVIRLLDLFSQDDNSVSKVKVICERTPDPELISAMIGMASAASVTDLCLIGSFRWAGLNDRQGKRLAEAVKNNSHMTSVNFKTENPQHEILARSYALLNMATGRSRVFENGNPIEYLDRCVHTLVKLASGDYDTVVTTAIHLFITENERVRVTLARAGSCSEVPI